MSTESIYNHNTSTNPSVSSISTLNPTASSSTTNLSTALHQQQQQQIPHPLHQHQHQHQQQQQQQQLSQSQPQSQPYLNNKPTDTGYYKPTMGYYPNYQTQQYFPNPNNGLSHNSTYTSTTIDPYYQQQQQQVPIQQVQTYPPQHMYQNTVGAMSNTTKSVSPLVMKIAQVCPQPPFNTLEISNQQVLNEMAQVKPVTEGEESNYEDNKATEKRARRKSKFTKEQDDLILKLKKNGKSWSDIADIAKTGSFLAARNRYQVLIGQQGGGNSEFEKEDYIQLKSIVDYGEFEKFRFLSKEFEKVTGKIYSLKQLRELVRYLFWLNPSIFEVDENYLNELINLQNNIEP